MIETRIRATQMLSDGIVIEFEDGKASYFPTKMLRNASGDGVLTGLLREDPSPAYEAEDEEAGRRRPLPAAECLQAAG